MNYIDVVPDLRGHLQFIESHTIATLSSPKSIPLFTILKDFPAFRSFNLSIPRFRGVHLTHGDDEDENEAAAIVVDGSTKIFPERYQLQRFCIDSICTDLRVLERLLVTCPDLCVFNAKEIDIGLTIRQEGSNVDVEEESATIAAVERKARQRLIDLATKHCPKLEWYSLHMVYCESDKEDLRGMARTFPDLKMQSIAFSSNSCSTTPWRSRTCWER